MNYSCSDAGGSPSEKLPGGIAGLAEVLEALFSCPRFLFIFSYAYTFFLIPLHFLKPSLIITNLVLLRMRGEAHTVCTLCTM